MGAPDWAKESGLSGCSVTVTVLQVTWDSACGLPTHLYLGLSSSVDGVATPAPTPVERLPFCVQKGSPCGVLALETCLCQGQSMCLTGSPDLELRSGFSANLMLFLWLYNHIILVAKKLSFIEHWIEWLHYDNIPCRCQENSTVPK